jgi:tetraacyldisaccharide 4'-kinase
VSAAARLANRLWRGTGYGAVLARSALLPVAALYRLVGGARNAAYDAGWLASRQLSLPSVGVGNLAVGGTGKTPLAAWLARELARRGCAPAVVTRGYGGDEQLELQELLPGLPVVAGADRLAATAVAAARGANVVVLDDCLQHRRVRPDVMLAVVAAETWFGNPWPLPAGPWREGPAALARCDAVIVTARTAGNAEAAALAQALARRTRGGVAVQARVSPARLRPLEGGEAVEWSSLASRRVVGLFGIGEPRLLADQLEKLGVGVALRDMGDHHAYTAADVREAIAAAGPGGAVVTTGKDAVKLRELWPGGPVRCWVAEADLMVAAGAEALAGLLDGVATAALRYNRGTAAAPPARET